MTGTPRSPSWAGSKPTQLSSAVRLRAYSAGLQLSPFSNGLSCWKFRLSCWSPAELDWLQLSWTLPQLSCHSWAELLPQLGWAGIFLAELTDFSWAASWAPSALQLSWGGQLSCVLPQLSWTVTVTLWLMWQWCDQPNKGKHTKQLAIHQWSKNRYDVTSNCQSPSMISFRLLIMMSHQFR